MWDKYARLCTLRPQMAQANQIVEVDDRRRSSPLLSIFGQNKRYRRVEALPHIEIENRCSFQIYDRRKAMCERSSRSSRLAVVRWTENKFLQAIHYWD